MRMTGWAILVAVAFATCSVSQAAPITTVMYNDTVGPTGTANVTQYSGLLNNGDGLETTSGLLKDFATGLDTGITATLTAVNIENGLGDPANGGTPSDGIFGGIVNLDRSASYFVEGDPWSYSVVFTGLDPSSTYEFVTTANRGKSAYDEDAADTNDERWADFSIIGANTFADGSTVSPGVVSVAANTVRLNAYQTVRGDIVRWTGITAADGSFEVLSASVPANQGFDQDLKGYGLQAFRLTEVTPDLGPGPAVPEPSSLALLACGAIGLMGYRRRKQKLEA